MPVMLYALSGVVPLAAAMNRERLAAIVAEALKRANLTQDYAGRAAGIKALSKLSDQLQGKAPLTGLAHLLASDELFEETTFWREIAALMADEVGFAVVPRDLGSLLDRLHWFLSVTPKPMTKASLSPRSVVLPLTHEQKAQR